MSGISALSTDSRTAQTDAYSGMKTDQFIKIMFTELSNQDPFKPNDSAALLEQISSIRQIQSDIDMGSKLESLVKENQLASASSLIGKLVSGVSETDDRVIGKVLSVSRTEDGPILNLDEGSRVRFDQVDELVDPEALTPITNPDDGSRQREDDGMEGNG